MSRRRVLPSHAMKTLSRTALGLALGAQVAIAFGPRMNPVTSLQLAQSVWMRIQERWPQDTAYDHEARRLELVLALHDERARGRAEGEGARFLGERLDEVERDHCDSRDLSERARRVVLEAARARELRQLLAQHRAATARLRSLERLTSSAPPAPREAGWMAPEDPAEPAPPPPPPSALDEARLQWRQLPRLEPFLPVPICWYR